MQKKNTSTPTKRKAKTDGLAPYREQARIFINLFFSNKTPAFLRDLLQEWYTELESLTQVFWNDRRIAEIALPLMLKKAADLRIDVEALDTGFMYDVACGFTPTRDNSQHMDDSELSEPYKLHRDLELDAEAVTRLITSPRVPESIKEKLVDRFLEFTDEHSLAPEVIRAKYLLAVASHAEGGSEK
jgi:hypothetical protein